MITSYIPLCERDFFARFDISIFKINWNLTNVIAIISKVIEIYSLASFAFRPAINWKFSSATSIAINSGKISFLGDKFIFKLTPKFLRINL